jgi:hypothetical protein
LKIVLEEKGSDRKGCKFCFFAGSGEELEHLRKDTQTRQLREKEELAYK